MKTKTIIYNQQKIELLKKILSVISFLVVFYVLPLIGKPQLLLKPQVIFLAFICSLIFLTQPRVSLKESKQKKETDRNTMLLILFVSATGQIGSLVEWAFLRQAENLFYIITGIVLLIGGTAFRLYAIHTLGKYFTSVVQIKAEHKIITAGPYRFLRHPSYTGAFITMLGCAVFLQSIAGILIFGIAMLYVYNLRIETEEKTLLQNFKEEYAQYSSRTWKMFPLVW